MAIPGWQVRAYFDQVRHKAQESRAKVAGTTVEKTENGEMIGFPVLDIANGETPTNRLAPTPDNTPNRQMRWAFPRPWRINLLEDNIDKLEHFWSADSEYVIAAAAAYNRERAKRLYAAAIGDALETTEDRLGGSFTTVALPASQIVSAGGATSLITQAKIVQARLKLDDAVGGDVETFGPYYFAYSPLDLNATLTTETQLQSLDYVNRQALMTGQPFQWLGFNWIPTSQLPITGTVRHSVAWARQAMGCGQNGNRKMRAGERADLSYAMQVFEEDKYDYVRRDDKGVVQVDIDTTQLP